jgi:translation initiation factor 2B subunit (eIF-2B alpha/beta/delta family)
MEHVLDQDLRPELRPDRLLAAIDHHIEQRKTMPTRIQQSFAAYLRGRFLSEPQQALSILTLSASSTIRDSIVDAYSSLPISTLDLRILESRPLYEGVSMAAALAAKFQSKFPSPGDRDLKLTVYTDASAALASQNIDFVLLGADRISDSGWISNKTGSLPAVLSAKHVSPNAKVLIFSELEKVAEPGAVDEHRSEESDPYEVIRSWITGSTQGAKTFEGEAKHCVQNTSFEWVPAPLIDGYISEEGTLDVAAIQRQAQQVKQKADRYFGGGVDESIDGEGP